VQALLKKKESYKEEKTAIIIREPLLVRTTFTLQGAFDKIFNVYMPKILENNMFESDEIRRQYNENRKISID